MKRLNLVLIFALIGGLTFSCAQQSESESETQTQTQDREVSSSKYAAKHERGNKESRPSPNASVTQTIGTTNIKVTYGRPGMKGRTIFGDLQAYGERWRTGANEATVISFSDSVEVEGQALAPGAYSLHTIPQEDEWTIIFNNNIAWGTDYDENEDVLRVDVATENGESMEWFMIYFQGLSDTSAEMVLHWSSVKVPVTIEV